MPLIMRAPSGQTVSPQYAWMNDIVCVGVMRGFGGGEVVYDLFEIL